MPIEKKNKETEIPLRDFSNPPPPPHSASLWEGHAVKNISFKENSFPQFLNSDEVGSFLANSACLCAACSALPIVGAFIGVAIGLNSELSMPWIIFSALLGFSAGCCMDIVALVSQHNEHYRRSLRDI